MFNQSGTRAYVANQGDNTVSIVDIKNPGAQEVYATIEELWQVKLFALNVEQIVVREEHNIPTVNGAAGLSST